jgi:hypothetical protein
MQVFGVWLVRQPGLRARHTEDVCAALQKRQTIMKTGLFNMVNELQRS